MRKIIIDDNKSLKKFYKMNLINPKYDENDSPFKIFVNKYINEYLMNNYDLFNEPVELVIDFSKGAYSGDKGEWYHSFRYEDIYELYTLNKQNNVFSFDESILDGEMLKYAGDIPSLIKKITIIPSESTTRDMSLKDIDFIRQQIKKIERVKNKINSDYFEIGLPNIVVI